MLVVVKKFIFGHISLKIKPLRHLNLTRTQELTSLLKFESISKMKGYRGHNAVSISVAILKFFLQSLIFLGFG